MDADDLLWIVSNEGLSSYNGSQVTNYTNKEIKGIEDYTFGNIVIDKFNIIWLKDSNGFVHYLDRSRNLKSIKNDSSYVRFLNFLPTQEGQVELLGSNGHYKLNETTLELDTVHQFSEAISRSSARQVSTEDNGYFLLTFPGSLKLYNSRNGEVDFDYGLTSTLGSVMLNEKQILASSSRFNQLNVIDIEKNEIVQNLSENIKKILPNANTYYRYMTHIDEDHIGITSGHNGLFILNKKDFSFRNYAHEVFNTRSLSSDNTYHIYAHKNGNVFVTSRTTGINFCDLNRRDAESIAAFFDPETDQIFDGHINVICADLDDNLWLGTSKGLLKYDVDKKTSRFINLGEMKNGFLGIHALYTDEKNRIWVAAQNRGLVVLDANGREIKRFSIDTKYKINSNNVRGIIPGDDDHIWLPTASGLNTINFKTLEVSHEGQSILDQIPDVVVSWIWKKGDDIFIGSASQGNFLIKDNQVIEIGLGEDSELKYVQNFVIDDEGLLYQGTKSGVAISRYDQKSNKYLPFDKIMGKRTLSLEKDQNGNIWIANENMLYQYDPKEKTFVQYSEENGFGGGGFRINASFQDEKGMIYYGMNTGLARFDPLTINKPIIELNPRLTNIYDGENSKFVSGMDQIILPYSHNNVSIYYQNNDIWNAPKIYYEYSYLEDGSWTPALTNPILIQNISPGEYEVKLRASLDKETWTNAPNNAMVAVRKPWWKKTWFYGLLALLAIISGYIFYSFYKKIQDQQEEEKKYEEAIKKVSEIEMKALRAQMNPHFMFNSLNSINNFILKNDQENASDYLTNFAQLMRIILENSRHEWVSLESELKALRLYINMEKLRFENAFFFHEEISEDLNQLTTVVPPMLIQPYIENAIWHGLLPKKDGRSELTLKISKDNGHLSILVEDNGIGRAQSQKNKSKFNFNKKSFGMKIISERIKMINDIYQLDASVKIEDKSEISANELGTRVLLSMKLKKNGL